MSLVSSEPVVIKINVPESPVSIEDVDGIVRRALDVIITRLDNIDARFDNTDNKIDNLRYDLKDDMKEGFRKIQEQIDNLEKKIDQINLRDIESDMSE